MSVLEGFSSVLPPFLTRPGARHSYKHAVGRSRGEARRGEE